MEHHATIMIIMMIIIWFHCCPQLLNTVVRIAGCNLLDLRCLGSSQRLVEACANMRAHRPL